MVFIQENGGKFMTKQELAKCEKLMKEAIRYRRLARKESEEANKANGRGPFELLRLQAQNHLGYAEGINQCLSMLNFQHEKMGELRELL